jgi:hypothetical protein
MFSFSFVFSDWVFGYLSSCPLLTFKAVFCEEKLLCILNGYQLKCITMFITFHLGFCIFELILNIIMYVVKLTLHNIRSSMQNRHTQWKYKFFGLIYIECPFLVIALDNPIFGTMMSNQEKQLFEHFCFEFYAIWMGTDEVRCVWFAAGAGPSQKAMILLNNLIWIWQTKIHAWILARKGYI